MRARLIAPDAPEWAAVLASAPHDIHHLPGYASASARQDRGEAAALFVTDSGSCLLVPLIMRDIPGGMRDATSPYGYPGPLVVGDASEEWVAASMRTGIELMASDGFVSLFVRLHPLFPIRGLGCVGRLVRHGPIVVVDLSLSKEEIWHQTRANHRRDINRALRRGLVFSYDESDESFDVFARLYRETMARLSASSYYFFDDGYLAALRDALGDRLHLATVRIGEQIAAASMVTVSCGIVQSHLVAWDTEFAHHRPVKLMYHGIRMWAKEQGERWLNLGGGHQATDDGLLHFKQGFSHLTRPFTTLRIVLDPAAYRRLISRHGRTGVPPDPAAFFPAYRRP